MILNKATVSCPYGNGLVVYDNAGNKVPGVPAKIKRAALETGVEIQLTEHGWELSTIPIGNVVAEVAPAELEAILLRHPQISDAAVVPVPDREAGEIPKAFVVAEKLTEDQIMGYVESQVAPYKKVRAVEFVEEIPRSPTGKILRRVLVERERSAAG